MTIAGTLLFMGMVHVHAGFPQIIKLPKPKRIGVVPLVTVYMRGNYSSRIDDKAFSDQDLANLLWCVFGIHRYGEGWDSKRVFQDWDHYKIYVSRQNGIYKYEPFRNVLRLVNPKNLQHHYKVFGKFPCQLVLVIKPEVRRPVQKKEFTIPFSENLNAGAIYEKIFLACASQKWANRIYDPAKIKGNLRQILKLDEKARIAFVQAIGYSKPIPPKPVTYPYYKGFMY